MTIITVPAVSGDADTVLAAAIGDARPGDTVALTSDLEHTATVRLRDGITLDGQGHTLSRRSADPALGAHVALDTITDAAVRRLAVLGPANPQYDADRESQHAIAVRGSRNCAVFDSAACRVHGDGVYIGRVGDTTSEQVWCHGLVVHSTGRHGWACVAGRNVVVTGSRFAEHGRASINLEAHPGRRVEHVRIGHPDHPNIFGPSRLMWIAAQHSGTLADIDVSHATVHDPLNVLVHQRNGGRVSGLRIAHVRSTVEAGNPHGSAMRLWRVDDCTIEHVEQPFQAGRRWDADPPGMHLVHAIDSDVTIRGEQTWVRHG